MGKGETTPRLRKLLRAKFIPCLTDYRARMRQDTTMFESQRAEPGAGIAHCGMSREKASVTSSSGRPSYVFARGYRRRQRARKRTERPPTMIGLPKALSTLFGTSREP